MGYFKATDFYRHGDFNGIKGQFFPASTGVDIFRNSRARTWGFLRLQWPEVSVRHPPQANISCGLNSLNGVA